MSRKETKIPLTDLTIRNDDAGGSWADERFMIFIFL
jgi:hypothetical protein